MSEARDPLVFFELGEGIEIPGRGREDLGDETWLGRRHRRRIARPAIDADIRPPDLTWQRLDAAIAGKRAAAASAEPRPQQREQIDDDIVVNVARAGHHTDRQPTDELVPSALGLGPSEESLHAHRLGLAVQHVPGRSIRLPECQSVT